MSKSVRIKMTKENRDVLDRITDLLAGTAERNWEGYLEPGAAKMIDHLERLIARYDAEVAVQRKVAEHLQEFCPVCGQPDNYGDCDHTPVKVDS